MSEADLSQTLPDALARETLMMPNSEAWTVMGVRLATAGVRRVGSVRDEAWVIRRHLQATKLNDL